ncbi:MAG: hypothetical protein OXN44_10850 [Acidimicrobiaceae bacterium]|nr:hypothetical protein [Acidimicrobiaceae bacterium]MDE0607935.1 hypothetical protein [Acidimicrobiaceae bacterium]
MSYPSDPQAVDLMIGFPDVPLRPHVWPEFLHENAERVFKIPVTAR